MFAYADAYQSSWTHFEPYSFKEKKKLVGIDIEFSKKIFEPENKKIKFKKLPWNKSLKELEKGKLDFVFAATHTKEREKYAYFSSPYRQEKLSLVLHKHPRIILHFKTPSGMVNAIKKQNFKIGTVKSYTYPDKVVDAFIKKAASIKVNSTDDLVKAMYDKKIDGFITDRNEARKIVKKSKGKLSDVETRMKTSIRFMFSKKNFKKDEINKLNRMIKSIVKSKYYRKLLKKYYQK